jgi:hypothetical protein
MAGPLGDLVLLFNHGPRPAQVDYELPLGREVRAVREIVAGATLAPAAGARLRIATEVPAESVRVYRIDSAPR